MGHEGRLGLASDREHDQDLWVDMDMDTTDSMLLWGEFGNGTQTASGITLEPTLGIILVSVMMPG